MMLHVGERTFPYNQPSNITPPDIASLEFWENPHPDIETERHGAWLKEDSAALVVSGVRWIVSRQRTGAVGQEVTVDDPRDSRNSTLTMSTASMNNGLVAVTLDGTFLQGSTNTPDRVIFDPTSSDGKIDFVQGQDGGRPPEIALWRAAWCVVGVLEKHERLFVL